LLFSLQKLIFYLNQIKRHITFSDAFSHTKEISSLSAYCIVLNAGTGQPQLAARQVEVDLPQGKLRTSCRTIIDYKICQ
jgi:hypothetical protein